MIDIVIIVDYYLIFPILVSINKEMTVPNFK